MKSKEHCFRKILNYPFPVHGLMPVTLGVSLCLAAGCVKPAMRPSFDAGKCTETIPDGVDGLTILSGPRTEQSIIRDMVWPICNARVLYENMKKRNRAFQSGSATFKVIVEYTGEVRKVSVDKTTLASEEFLSRICEMIRSTDFVFWGRDRTDTCFFYPVNFER